MHMSESFCRLLDAEFTERLDASQMFRRVMNINTLHYPHARSMQEFISSAAVAHLDNTPDRIFPKRIDLDQTVAEFLQLPVRLRSQGTTMTEVLVNDFWWPVMTEMMESVTRRAGDGSEDRKTAREELISSCGASDEDQLINHLLTQNTNELIQRLNEILLRHIGHRTLRSYFVDESPGLKHWWSGVMTYAGTRLKTVDVPSPLGVVTVETTRYDNEANDIKVYEWNSAIVNPDDPDQPHAACSGMAYVLERRNGKLLSTPRDLVWASDCVSDVDVLQVQSFLGQHANAKRLMAASDLCFVWILERGTGPKGAGQACLEAALKNLKKRFPLMSTAVLEVSPYQFSEQTRMPFPPVVQAEHLEALDKLMNWALGLKLPMNLVLTAPQPRIDDGAVFRYLGRATQDLV